MNLQVTQRSTTVQKQRLGRFSQVHCTMLKHLSSPLICKGLLLFTIHEWLVHFASMGASPLYVYMYVTMENTVVFLHSTERGPKSPDLWLRKPTVVESAGP